MPPPFQSNASVPLTATSGAFGGNNPGFHGGSIGGATQSTPVMNLYATPPTHQAYYQPIPSSYAPAAVQHINAMNNNHSVGYAPYNSYPATVASSHRPRFPEMGPPPATSDRAYQFTRTTKLNSDNVHREFVLVQQRISILEYQVNVLKEQNIWQQEELTRSTQLDRASVLREIEKAVAEEVERKVQAAMEARGMGSEDDGEGSDSEDESDEEEEDEDTTPASQGAFKSSQIMELGRVMMNQFIGKRELKKKEDFPVFDENEDEENLPFVEGSNEVRQVRFNWEANAKNNHNSNLLGKIARYALSHGEDYVSTATPMLKVITFGDMKKRLTQRFTTLRRAYNGTDKVKPTKPGSEFNGTMERNRGRGKFNLRLHKRKLLPDDSEFQDEKFDRLFSNIRFMSPDYDLYGEDGELKTDSYLTRAHAYRSDIVNEALKAVDAVEVNEKNEKHTNRHIRVMGPTDEDKCLKTGKGGKIIGDQRVEHWMVSPEWLKKHSKCCDKPSKIAENPVGWGGEDPEEVEERFSRMKEDKAKGKKRRAQNDGGRDKAKRKKSGKKKDGRGKAKETPNNGDENGTSSNSAITAGV
ncbi:hypothetical protein EST38_g6658 [Candolleomyces aberdarensis]|uniref:Uncharacterized protein n=1 Tax=Candolleomyces aberdarensis TaxID=2316362 RepID=A0A4Q2DK21_9AGAR|nr:hypothetical protein EST38_g6658 [Candolleomyces aberdarensis]